MSPLEDPLELLELDEPLLDELVDPLLDDELVDPLELPPELDVPELVVDDEQATMSP